MGRWTLGALLVVAAALRFTALGFGGADFDARPDESSVAITLGAMDRGRLFPPFVAYGGGYFQPLHLVVRGWQAVNGHPLSQPSTAARELILVARVWSAALSLLTVVLVYLVGRRIGGARVGVLAAALLAVMPLAVREAHFAKADTAAAMASAAVMAALVLPSRHDRRRAALVGAAAGFALSTKMLLSVLPGVALGVAWPSADPHRRPDWGALVWTAAVCLIGMILLNMPALRHAGESLTSARAIVAKTSDASWLPGGDTVAGPLAYHPTVSLRRGGGIAIAALTLPAIVVGLLTRGSLRVVAVLLLGHAAALLTSSMVLARFLLPLYPELAVLIAALLVGVIDQVVVTGRRRVALTAVALLVLAEPMAASVQLLGLLGRADTRSLAGDWIAANVPPDARIVSWGAPPGAADFGRPPLGGRAVAQRLPPAEWTPGTYVVWHHHPLPYSSDPLPDGAPPLRRLITFDPFSDPRGASAVFEPLDAFYVPLGWSRGVERPGPRLEIFAVEPRAAD